MFHQVVDTALTPPEKKLSFVCIWFSFAFALFLLNREHKRKTFDLIPRYGRSIGIVVCCHSKVLSSLIAIFTFSNVDIGDNLNLNLNLNLKP